ncbi:carboxypeptidase-like regulatory domain-containing protein [Pontibacter rugosus]
MQKLPLLLLFILVAMASQAQTRLAGQVLDVATGEALPFVSIYIKNTSIGTSTDLDGRFTIKLATTPDSITASYVGYIPLTLPVKKGWLCRSLFLNSALMHSSYRR